MNGEVISYEVSDKKIEIVDILPGYTHSIENVGNTEVIVLFWANEMFDQNKPDTYYKEVLLEDD
jgi:UDP-2-acetamido-2,6-beta-L-arabino-hexul-4-ose reductase